jgi:NADPH:quinone reductase-like Zn-dependent oxidoreductase
MSLKALAMGGHVSLIGASLSPSEAGLDPLLLDRPRDNARLDQRRKLRRFRGDEPSDGDAPLAPVIDRTFPFADAKEAYRHFEGRGHFGKVVITHG